MFNPLHTEITLTNRVGRARALCSQFIIITYVPPSRLARAYVVRQADSETRAPTRYRSCGVRNVPLEIFVPGFTLLEIFRRNAKKEFGLGTGGLRKRRENTAALGQKPLSVTSSFGKSGTVRLR